MSRYVNAVKSIVRRKWEKTESILMLYKCSKCGSGSYEAYNYCPNCGRELIAKQKSKQEDITKC